MNIAVIGPASFPGSLVGSYVAAFRTVGHDVCVFDTIREAIGPMYGSRDDLVWRAARRASVIVNHVRFRALLPARLRRARRRIDVAIDFGSPWLTPPVIDAVRRVGMQAVFHYNADSPFDQFNSHSGLLAALPCYDLYFTPFRRLMARLRKSGARDVEHLPFAWDPGLHPASGAVPALSAQAAIAFVGSWTVEREKWLAQLRGASLQIYGPRWGRACDVFVRRCIDSARREVVGREFAALARAVAINLNFLRPQCQGSHNMRTFEIPGSSGFLLTEDSEEQREYLEPDTEAVYFADAAELRDKIAFYLGRDDARRRIARAGHARVASQTYVDRARRMLATLGARDVLASRSAR